MRKQAWAALGQGALKRSGKNRRRTRWATLGDPVVSRQQPRGVIRWGHFTGCRMAQRLKDAPRFWKVSGQS